MVNEPQIEYGFVGKLIDLKYTYQEGIRDRKSLEDNFRKKFEVLNRVKLTDAEFARLRDEIINPDVFTASKILRQRNTFQREDDTPLHYTLVNIKDWCKNDFEVIRQLRMNTENSSHRYDVILLINGVPVVQIELKTLEVSPRRAIPAAISFTMGNILLSLNCVGDRNFDVTTIAAQVDDELHKSATKSQLEKGKTKRIKPTNAITFANEPYILSKNLKKQFKSTSWVKIIVSDGELKRRGDELIYTSSKEGKKTIDIFATDRG